VKHSIKVHILKFWCINQKTKGSIA
jgi:hypothetical protein